MIGKILAATAAALVASASMSAVSAQDYRGGEFRRFEGQKHRFGERCTFRVESRGMAEKKLFGGGAGMRKAEARAIQHWESQVSSNLGPQFASWSRAQAKNLSCRPKGIIDLECIAAANPCREGGREGGRR